MEYKISAQTVSADGSRFLAQFERDIQHPCTPVLEAKLTTLLNHCRARWGETMSLANNTFTISFDLYSPFPNILELLFASSAKTYLTTDTESFEGVQSQPATVACISEAVHELCVKGSLDLGQTYQNDVFFLRRELNLQHVVASPVEEIKRLR